VEVVNKDLVLATLTDDVPFELEMVVENGRGYVPASEQGQESQEIGIIPVDAVFSPVTRVKYEVEETRVGQKTNYDKLTLEIWTDGTVTPEMALVEAAKILRKHLNPFVAYTEPGPALALPAAASVFAVEAPLESRLGMLVSDLRLSLRAANCLHEAGIESLRDLVSRTREELSEVRNMGDVTVQEIEEKLREVGLRLGMELPAGAGA
jgi:DNA-directed RNA polymerase subunit alpha